VSLSIFSPAPRPANERERQRAVEACGILRAPPDPSLHQLVTQAAKLFNAPIAGLSIIDRDRMWFAARIGIDTPATSRSTSFCAHAILNPEEPLVVLDAIGDERFEGNPIVQGDPGVRFYVGVPVRSADGHPLGALCVIDVKPRAEPLPLIAMIKLAERAGQAIADLARSGETLS